MFIATDTAWAPWSVAHPEDKKRVRLNIISHLLAHIPYEALPVEPVKLPKRKIGQSQTIGSPASHRASPLARGVSPGSPLPFLPQRKTGAACITQWLVVVHVFPFASPIPLKATFRSGRARRPPMLRLFALLLVCLVLPVRALTLTPGGGGAVPPWGSPSPRDGSYPVSERPCACCASTRVANRHVVSGLPPLAATGQGSARSRPGTAMAGSISATASRGRRRRHRRGSGPTTKRRPHRLATAVSPRAQGSGGAHSAPAWC